MLSRLWWPKIVWFVLNAVRSGVTRVQHVGELSTFEESPTGLDLPGRPVPVFTPGHTSGHCAFQFPGREALITGDPLTRETGPRVIHKAFNLDQEQTVHSFGRLRDLEAEVVPPGHDQPFHGSPADAVDMALARI